MRFAELCDDYLRVPEHDLARVRERYVSRARRARRARLRRPPARGGRAARAGRRDASDVPERVPLHPRRRVPGHERRAGAAARAARRRAAQRLLRRGRGSVDLRLPRRGDRQHAPLRRALAGRAPIRPAVNYRSAAPIVELATSVIRRNVDTHLGKELRAEQDRPAEIVGRTFRHAAEEADWIAREIAALRQEGLQLGQIAVLARSLKEIGPRLAYTLRTHGISFHAPLAPQLHPSADALLSLLELAAAYPWEPAHDDAALRVLASPLFGANPLELRRYRREPRTLYGALRDGGRFRAVLRGAGDRQAPANRGRRDLRPLGAARALPRARVSGRDARADRGARRRDRALRRRQRVRRRAGRVPDGVPRGRARDATTGCRLRRRRRTPSRS